VGVDHEDYEQVGRSGWGKSKDHTHVGNPQCLCDLPGQDHVLVWPSAIRCITNNIHCCFALFCILGSAMYVVKKKYGLLGHPKLIMYGDDNIGNLDKMVWSEIPDVVQTVFGMTFTSAFKDSDVYQGTLREAIYLSRRWVYEGGMWQAPLPLSRVRSILDYSRDGERDTLQDTVRAFCLEMTMFGGEVYQQHYQLLVAHPYVVLAKIHVETWDQAMKIRLGSNNIRPANAIVAHSSRTSVTAAEIQLHSRS